MSHSRTICPSGYSSKLSVYETQIAIKLAKDTFERQLAEGLNLTRVSAPLFVTPQSGLNDNLNGVERPVAFDIPDVGCTVEIVHSLAKWKRMALGRYGFVPGSGLYTDMNAIRRDEVLDNLHSVYVDQWDWEKVITPQQRTLEHSFAAAKIVADTLRRTKQELRRFFPILDMEIPETVTMVSSQELEDRYPQLTPKERENAAAKEYGMVFLTQIGGALKSGKPHDGRAPDYDDWQLNGDLLIWYPLLNQAVELSSMGVRVDPDSLLRQLETAGCPERQNLPFHQQLLSGRLPLTMGGGIGQSRLCMVLLEKAHIGEVQASCWPAQMETECEENGILLL